MRLSSTLWHTLALALVAAGCTSSHTTDCPAIAGECMTECCESSGRPTFDEACNPICPAGTSLIDRCAPAPACGCPVGDAALPVCGYGPCCTDSVGATLDEDCDWTCPSGATLFCSPAPGCGCWDDLDAGPPPLCLGGPCCTETATPTRGAECAYVCPEGLALDCTPSPTADCPAPWLSCTEPADCILAADEGCCFPCGETLSLEHVTAVHREHASAYYESQCPGELECPDCIRARNPSLRTTCGSSGQCEVFDVRRLPLSACTSDAECRVRVPDCCECGAVVDPEDLIALHVDEVGAYTARVCSPLEGACPPCAPVYPDTVEAYCAADGHCDIRAVP